MVVSITYKFEDSYAPRLVAAFCATYGYQPTVPDPDNPGQVIQNPEIPAAFARRKVAEYAKEVTASHEIKVATETARTTEADKVKSEVSEANVDIEAVQE